MATTNLFDYIVFPEQQSRQKVRKEYFDTQKLFLNINNAIFLQDTNFDKNKK